jgi:trehalose 6-phosphate phosphatase
MPDLLSPSGQAALRRLGTRHSLLAFDLDGTLAPLLPCRDEAVVPPCTAEHLQALARHWPVAVITGRRVDDARERLGFRPRYLIGNHGAERPGCPMPDSLSRQLDPCRAFLRTQSALLRAQGVELEDKGLSLALHYVRAARPAQARAWLDAQCRLWGTGVRCVHGHCVLNVTPAAAPDKGHALLSVMRHCGAEHALVVGDDSNDEAAFACAPRGSVSVRIGPRDTPTEARFRLASQRQVEPMLARLLTLWTVSASH